MKHFLASKTFWAAVLAAVLEILTNLQQLPFISEQAGHVISILLIAFIAVNRALK